MLFFFFFPIMSQLTSLQLNIFSPPIGKGFLPFKKSKLDVLILCISMEILISIQKHLLQVLEKKPHSFNNENTCFLTVIINVKLKMSIWCNANKLGKLHKESERIFLHVKRAPEFGSSLDLAAIEQILVVLRQ